MPPCYHGPVLARPSASIRNTQPVGVPGQRKGPGSASQAANRGAAAWSDAQRLLVLVGRAPAYQRRDLPHEAGQEGGAACRCEADVGPEPGPGYAPVYWGMARGRGSGTLPPPVRPCGLVAVGRPKRLALKRTRLAKRSPGREGIWLRKRARPGERDVRSGR